jgi:hypothetical protein
MSEHQPIPGTPAQQHAIRLLKIELMREEQTGTADCEHGGTRYEVKRTAGGEMPLRPPFSCQKIIKKKSCNRWQEGVNSQHDNKSKYDGDNEDHGGGLVQRDTADDGATRRRPASRPSYR